MHQDRELAEKAMRVSRAVNALLAELPRYPVGSWIRPTHGRMDELWGEVDASVDALGAHAEGVLHAS